MGRRVAEKELVQPGALGGGSGAAVFELRSSNRTVPSGARPRVASRRAVASAWADLDADAYPFVRSIADQLRDHDNRTEFFAGIDLILAGISARA